ncbi:MAG: hypothetical protein KGL39_51895 [Patescibacteria group bacterium]|nr:hypothetical protein [Patescibacteria group bacterium]
MPKGRREDREIWNDVVADMAVGEYRELAQAGKRSYRGLAQALRRHECEVKTEAQPNGRVRVWKLSGPQPLRAIAVDHVVEAGPTQLEAIRGAPDWAEMDRRLLAGETVFCPDRLTIRAVERRWMIAGRMVEKVPIPSGVAATGDRIQPQEPNYSDRQYAMVCLWCWRPFYGGSKALTCSGRCREAMSSAGGAKAAQVPPQFKPE